MRHAIAGHAVNATYTDAGSAGIAGANTCHPCKLDSSIPAADGPAIACRIIITETHEKGTLYSRLSVAWMLQSSLHGCIYGAS